jgi:hypothetical protein
MFWLETAQVSGKEALRTIHIPLPIGSIIIINSRWAAYPEGYRVF